MKLRILLSTLLFVLIIFSCGKDEDPPTPVAENNKPEMENQTTDQVLENQASGTVFYQVIATDKDEEDTLVFSISENDNGLFSISAEGDLSVAPNKQLDYETAKEHQVTVSVSDSEDSKTAVITIDVGDVNEAPEMDAQEFSVTEGASDNFVFGTVQAEDPEQVELGFSITVNSDELFEITEDGNLSLAEGQAVDLETPSHTIMVSVSDGQNTVEEEMTITVTAGNEDNSIPEIDPQTFVVKEDIADTFEIATVAAKDDDEGDTLTFYIYDNVENGLFEITQGGILSLAEGRSLDFESVKQYTIIVRVGDGQTEAGAPITIDVSNVNEAPEFNGETSFMVAEDIADDYEIAQITATDPDEGDTLAYHLTDDANGLFEITTAGMLSLANGQSLDYETKTQYTLKVKVDDDGGLFHTEDITITVTDVNEIPLAEDEGSFILTWQTQNAGESVGFYTGDYAYDYLIDWGDGTPVEHITVNTAQVHVYDTPGEYKMAIKGVFPTLKMADGGNVAHPAADKLIEINQWGNVVWKDMARAFMKCSNVTYKATDEPDLTEVTDLTAMFLAASAFNGDLSNWDVSNITNMNAMFRNAISFDGNIGNWITGNVTNMSFMFYGASSFNRNLNNWDVSQVYNMIGMFNGASSFNQDLDNWTVGSVEYMAHMFQGASAFNGNISTWTTTNVEDMSYMFDQADAFDQDLGDWNLKSVTTMEHMLDNSGLSLENYTYALAGWSDDLNTPNDLTLGAAGLLYCDLIQNAHDNLTQNKGWIINDSGSAFCEL